MRGRAIWKALSRMRARLCREIEYICSIMQVSSFYASEWEGRATWVEIKNVLNDCRKVVASESMEKCSGQICERAWLRYVDGPSCH